MVTGPSNIRVLREGQLHMSIGMVAWGPNWSWTGVEGSVRPSGDPVATEGTIRLNTGAVIELDLTASVVGANRLRLDASLVSDRDTDLTGVAVTLQPHFDGELVVAGSEPVPLPLGIRDYGATVGGLEFAETARGRILVGVSPPAPVTTDRTVRVALVQERLVAGQPYTRRLELEFPTPVRVFAGSAPVPSDRATQDWFPFRPEPVGTAPDELSMSHWLDAPAGRHGRVLARGNQLFYNDRPIRLWGLNVCFADCAPPKELANKRADFYARMGINAVRLHKYADGPGWAGIQSPGSFEEFDPEALDRMDYFVAALKRRGIFVKLSPTFGVTLGPDDLDSVPYLEEFGPMPARGERVHTRHGTIFLSREVQDLQIRQTVAILRHRNPYTGLAYAEDPAVAIVEMFNEDSALFFGTMDRLQQVPTLRRRASQAFTRWLKARYGTEQALLQAWGPQALNSFVNEGFTNESWSEETIVPAGNPWFFDPDQLAGSQSFRAARLRDTMLFLYEIQNEFYARFYREIRNTGFEGEVMSSNWIAGRAYSHFYNLHSDSLIGMVDRHNYFGGGEGEVIRDGSMLARPGSGMLSTGMDHVENRPFSLSEWIHVWPNEWGAEGPSIIGVYGMGLQGWDVSFMFQNRDSGTFSEFIGRDQWDVTAPQVMALFPAVSRLVHRGDVATSSMVIPRNVHVPSLHRRALGFDDRSWAAGDIKGADSSTVPMESLAVGRSVVRFTAQWMPTRPFDVSRHVRGGSVVSSTGQLAWRPGTSPQSGWFTVNTPGTQALIGFAHGQTARLADVTIESRSPFAAIYATAREENAGLSDADSVLVTAMARARNTGMRVVGPLLLERGGPPVLLEPVQATLSFRRRAGTVHVLNHAGQKTGRSFPLRDGVFELDTSRDQTCWYLVTFR